MSLHTSKILKDRVRDLVFTKAEAYGLGTAVMEQIKADPRHRDLYAAYKDVQRKNLIQEAKVLGLIGGDLELLARLMRDVHADIGQTVDCAH